MRVGIFSCTNGPTRLLRVKAVWMATVLRMVGISKDPWKRCRIRKGRPRIEDPAWCDSYHPSKCKRAQNSKPTYYRNGESDPEWFCKSPRIEEDHWCRDRAFRKLWIQCECTPFQHSVCPYTATIDRLPVNWQLTSLQAMARFWKPLPWLPLVHWSAFQFRCCLRS